MSETLLVLHFRAFLPCITNQAQLQRCDQLSVTLKRPQRIFNGITDSRASTFTDGSDRVQISVIRMCARPTAAPFLATGRQHHALLRWGTPTEKTLRLCSTVSSNKSTDLSERKRDRWSLGCATLRNDTLCIRAQIRGVPFADDLELSNAFTSAFKEPDPIPQFKTTAKLAEFLETGFSRSF